MLKILCLGICIFLMVLGLIEIIKSIIIRITSPKNYMENSTIVIPVKQHNEEIEFLLRRAIYKVLWDNPRKNTNIICLDCGMDYETRKICELMCKDYEFIKLYDINDVDSEIIPEN